MIQAKLLFGGAPDLAHVNFCKLLRDNSVIVDSIRTGIVIFATY